MRLSLRFVIPCIALLASLATPTFAAELQEWTDRSGSFTIRATFVELKDEKIVVLKDEDGEELEIELDELNVDSKMAAQKAQMMASRKNPFKKSGSSKPSPFKRSKGSDGETSSRMNDTDADSSSRRRPIPTGPAKSFTITKPGKSLAAGAGNMFGSSSKSWKVEPDGRTFEHDIPENGLRATLPNIHYRFKGMATALDGSGAVVMWHNPFGGRDGAPAAGVCAFDLADGKAGKPFGVEKDGFPVAVGEGGDTVLIRTIPDRGKPHELIYAAITSKGMDPIWTAIPFGESEDAGKQSISWAALLPNGTVAVANHGEAFRVFDPETEQAVFDAKIPRNAVPAISPGGNQIALSNGGTITVYDTDSFDVLGSVALPNERIGQRITFNSDGTEIAVAGGGQMAVVDAATGKIKTQGIGIMTNWIEHPFDQPGAFVHAGGSLYLVKDQLVDTDSRMHVWTYEGLSSASRLGDKTLLLFDVAPPGQRGGLAIAGQLPHPPAREILDQYKERDDLYAFKPGDTFKLDTSSVPAGERQTVVDAFNRWAVKNNTRIDDSSNIVLRLSTKSGKPVEQEYRSFGFGSRGGTEKASFTPTLGVGTLTIDGRQVWTGETGLSSTFLPFMIRQEVSKVVADAKKLHYDRYVGVAPPQYVFDPAVVQIPLGTSTVGMRGFVDKVNVGG